MALKIRLWQQGCRNRRCFRIVVADGRSPRDGKYVEAIGQYNPSARDEKWFVKSDRLEHWLSVGAELSPTVHSLMKKASPDEMKAFLAQKQATKAKRTAKRKKAAE